MAKKMAETKHIVHVFDGFRVGGTEVRTARILNAIGSNYRHTVVSLNGNFDARALLREDLTINFISPPYKKTEQIRNIFRYRRLLHSLKPNLLITYGWSPIEWVIGNAVFPCCPVLQAEEGFADEEMAEQIGRRRMLRALFFRRCTAVVVCSKTLQNLAQKSWRLNANKVVHIHNGVDLSRFALAETEPPTDGDRPIIFGIVASLLKVKNHLLLLKAFATIARRLSGRVHIVGDGPERGVLQDFIADAHLSATVKLLGHQADPAPFIAAFDIFCLSSRSEQMPLSVLEAMAAGKPVVSTNAGDVKYMVSEQNAPFIVGVDDETQYAAALLQMGTDRVLRGQVGMANNRKCKELFSDTLMFANYQRLYDGLLDRRPVSSHNGEVVVGQRGRQKHVG